MKLMGYNSQMETTIDSLRSVAFLLVGFFARARASVLAIVVASATAVGLAACGGGGGDGVGNVGNGNGGGGNGRGGVPNLMNPMAYFHGAERVEGLQYQYKDGSSGETDARGGFQFEQGKTVVFSIGEATTLGTVVVSSDAERDFVTPLRFVGNNDDQAVRVERLLIALDDDSNLNDDSHLDNGIKIPVAAMTSTTNLLEIIDLRGEGMTVVDGLTLDIPSKMRAQQALERTNNCAYSGVFAGNFASDDIAIVLMPNLKATLTVGLDPELELTNASPIVSFINGEGGEVAVGETVLTIDLKIPPLTATIPVKLDDEMMATGTIVLASYDQIEFRVGSTLGVVRRVTGDPNADYRLAGIDGEGGGAFVADIYDGTNARTNARISYIDSPDSQDVLDATRTGVFPTSGTTVLNLQVNAEPANSVALTLFADSNIFLGLGGNIGGTWCEL